MKIESHAKQKMLHYGTFQFKMVFKMAAKTVLKDTKAQTSRTVLSFVFFFNATVCITSGNKVAEFECKIE